MKNESAEHLIVLRCGIHFSARPGDKRHLSYLLKALGTAVSPPTRNRSQASENKLTAISYSIHSWWSRHATFNFRKRIFFGLSQHPKAFILKQSQTLWWDGAVTTRCCLWGEELLLLFSSHIQAQVLMVPLKLNFCDIKNFLLSCPSLISPVLCKYCITKYYHHPDKTTS